MTRKTASAAGSSAPNSAAASSKPSKPSQAAKPARTPRKLREHLRAPQLSMDAWRQFIGVAKPYWLGSQKRRAWTLLAVLIVLMLAQTQLAVLLNNQAGEMTSALAAKEGPRFWHAVWLCLAFVGIVVPATALYYYMRDQFSNQWRRWLTNRFLDGYLADRRYYELGASGELDNPDQRISEDINNFTGRSINFLLIFMGSAMQLVAFSAVLWSISKPLVAFLAVYSVLGTVMALWVFGQPLIQLNFWQIRREADFRFGLMRLRENAEAIAFYRGEKQERAQLDKQFESVYDNYGKLIKKQRSLNLFQTAFSQMTLVVPSIILADGVLSGALEVGRAVQAAGAFAAVLGAVAVIVDNFESLSRFVAGIGRLDTLSKQVLKGSPNAGQERIESRVGPHVALEGVTLRTPQFDRVLVEALNLELPPGEGLLITGVSGCGKSSLLRAIAGLWRGGSGTVQHPDMAGVLFLPQQPYMQVGSLRSQLIYPSISRPVEDERLLEILDEVQLGGLAERVGGLDAVQDWEKLLSVGERQRLAFARALVHEPELLILDEATSALDGHNEAALYQRLLKGGERTLISIAHRPALLRYHTRVLELKGDGNWTLHEAGSYQFDS